MNELEKEIKMWFLINIDDWCINDKIVTFPKVYNNGVNSIALEALLEEMKDYAVAYPGDENHSRPLAIIDGDEDKKVSKKEFDAALQNEIYALVYTEALRNPDAFKAEAIDKADEA